jgi:hypothetical protein
MSKKTLRYKDTLVAANSNLGQALLNNNTVLAEKLYKEAEADFKKLYGKQFDTIFEKYKNDV